MTATGAKALVLAAGFGTRLAPYTEHMPKPLFPVGGRPLLERVIRSLCRAGCGAVVVNTHHHAERIAAFVASQHYPIPVSIRHEPEILGTGGAIANLADFWDRRPFWVINSDIVTDIDLGRVYADHLADPHPATLVLVDCAEFNTVSVNPQGFVEDFTAPGSGRLAFTGIQVLDPAILESIPTRGFSTSIDAFRRVIAAGGKIKAWVAHGSYWKDIGTPRRYFEANFDQMAPEAFLRAHGEPPGQPVKRTLLAGDGSDRRWYRIEADGRRLVMADHGIRPTADGKAEVDATVAIGAHLSRKGLPVPRIHLADRFCGLVFFQDLGDTHLQHFVERSAAPQPVAEAYEEVVGILVRLWRQGADGFDPAWAWQTPSYDHSVVIERECRYFVEAFVREYLGREVDENALEGDFRHLADRIAADGLVGFMHRDLQSRNIMVHGGRFYFIDCQGGRLGPLQYDLASLLIDPYVGLPEALAERLFEHCLQAVGRLRRVDPLGFRRGFDYCCISRNLQILGAFGFLTRIKRKPHFEACIAPALETLRCRLARMADPGLARLQALVAGLGPPQAG